MPERRNRWTAPLLRFFSSVWVGVLWLVLLFIYCSIGSAFPLVRQHPLLEMTEFQWFHWWPFNVLIILLCTSLIVTTLRRIPLRWVNGGVWMVHVGIIVLCIGSYYYFGTKVEGDAPVFRRRVRIEVPGLDSARSLVALPGAHARVLDGANAWHFTVQSTNTAWPILSDEHAGKHAYAVNVRVTPPSGEPFLRMLLAGYPEYTEDIIPGEGRAIKSTGKKLVDASLKLSLEYEPQEYFHVMDSWAIHVRGKGGSEWSQRRVRNLPRYHDRVPSRDQVFTDARYPVSPRPLDLAVPAPAEGDAFGDASVRITGYLRYARMQQQYVDGGERLNPVVKLRFLSGDEPGQLYELVAFDPARRELEGGVARFVWLDSASEAKSLATDSRPLLRISVPADGAAPGASMEVEITPRTVVGHEGEFTSIDGSDLAYRILNIHDNLMLPGGNRSVSVAMVEIRTPEGTFTRMVADQPKMTRDMHGEAADPHDPGQRKPRDADPRVLMTYQPASAPLILAAHPEGLYFIYSGLDGRGIRREVEPGEIVELMPGLSVRVEALLRHAVAQAKPMVVPPPARRRNVGEAFAMIRLEIDTGHGLQAQWVPFNRYVLPGEEYAYHGRFAYTPRMFRLGDGRDVEVIFSRERRRLPASITLEDFEIDAHVGGYSGSTSTIRNYVSRLRFLDQGEWTPPTAIAVNAPTDFGGYWYFQSTWDRPSPGDPDGGMNYTGIGVGNRNGVYIQLLGCCISVAGMIFAFYVKPMIQRRRRDSSRARAARQDRADEATPVAGNSAEAVGV